MKHFVLKGSLYKPGLIKTKLTLFCEVDEVSGEQLLEGLICGGQRPQGRLQTPEERQDIQQVEGEAAGVEEPGGGVGRFGRSEGH